ncbi:hypothetical protein COHA_009556 [Chlorella ohadii]|uniref:ubiquitinyl hydrolase 1 n=1 Tax=Chlorella ohadii TaxID=2649997 RepID=A0AAD5H0J2_9CHLO|nr:hypothetical protein COHA_009556 [Chlorella ohadii]
MLLRVRGPGGQTTLKLEPDATVAALKALLEERTGRRRREGDSRQPCFDPGHPFAPVYDHGWLTLPTGPPEGRAERLSRFLADYRPWAADVPDDLAWIAVSSGRPASNGSGGGGGAALDSYEERCARAEQEWTRKPAAQRTAAAAQQIGQECGITSGKWMVRTTPEDEGLCASAKISAGPQGGRPHQQAGQRVICVYTDDFSDKQDAMRVNAGLSAALRAAQPQRAKWPQITYKPDIYTHLGLYYGNSDGIKPTIYSKKL